MFWSGTLLNATGPLAKAWLSANMERKLSKTHILQHNLQDSVEAIITPNQAPMALRLSGQLLLGVVRIYGRKARYLLDDCNEALMKIKMAFRSSGNHDIPANLHVQNREALLLPDRITPYDNLELLPPPDAGWLLSQIDDVTSTPLGRKGRVNNRDINLQEDFNNSQFLQDNEDDFGLANMDDLDLELDFGMDIDERPSKFDKSIEIGRNAPAGGNADDDIFSDLDMGLHNKGLRDHDLELDLDFGGGVRIADDEGDIRMGGDDFQFNIGDQSAMPGARAMALRARISESPLSDIDPDFAKEVETEYSRHAATDLYEPGDETERSVARRAAQRAKKRKVLVPDEQTMLSSAHIKEQQQHHNNIIKPQSFLPRDPYFLNLMEAQKNGSFVSNVLLDGRSASWAPELRGMLSIHAIRPQNDLKRKRDSGIADMGSDLEQGASKSPRLQLGGDDPFAMSGALMGDQTVGPDGTVLEIPGDDGGMLYHNDDDHVRPPSREGGSPLPAFDDTTAPLVHPADSGPVSIATKHAVHILRDLFGAEAAANPEKRKKTSVVFQDLLPEERTSKADATKMFFECLVLATKDAIKVEQPEGYLGGSLRIRGKRGLWGQWAEKEAGGEIARQENEPEPAVANGTIVSVEA